MGRLLLFLVVAVALGIALSTIPGSPVSSTHNGGGSDLKVAVPTSRVPPSPQSPVPWPTYLFSPERTGANPWENTIAPSNVSNLTELWSLPANGSDFSAPIVVGNILYYGSWNGYESAVNVATGAILWREYLGTDSCGAYSPMGISSTPAYLDGTLYLGGGDGTWYALNSSTGAIDWSFYLGTLPAVNNFDWASALVYGNSLYIGVSSCFDNPLIRGALIQVNLTGAHTANHTFYTVPAGQTGDSIWTTPSLDPDNNTIWVATGNENTGYPIYANAIIGLNATTLAPLGSWQVPNVEGQDSDFGSTPTLFRTASGIPLVAATNKNGVAYALNRSNVSASGSWAPIWSLDTSGGFSSGAFYGGILYLAGNGLYAVDPNNGTVIWENPTPTNVYSALDYADGIVYVGSEDVVYAIDAQNGTTLWNATVPGGGSIVAESVADDGRLYVPSGNYGTEGNLTAYGLPFAGGATAGPTSGLANLSVDFHAVATGGLEPHHFYWAFGDGSYSTVADPVHTYTAGGNYTATVWINDSAGGSVDRSFDVHVIPALISSIGVTWLNLSCSASRGPLQVELTAGAVGGVPPYSYSWTLGSLGTATGGVVVRDWTSRFVADLTTTDSAGYSTNASLTIGPVAIDCPATLVPFPWTFVIEVGLLIAAVAVGVGVVLWTRRKRSPPPESPGGPPTPDRSP